MNTREGARAARIDTQARWPWPPGEVPRDPPIEVPSVPEIVPGPAPEIPAPPIEVPRPAPGEFPEPSERGRSDPWISRFRPST
jgi:hypothetical protein